jgi:chromosome segregation ATPase
MSVAAISAVVIGAQSVYFYSRLAELEKQLTDVRGQVDTLKKELNVATAQRNKQAMEMDDLARSVEELTRSIKPKSSKSSRRTRTTRTPSAQPTRTDITESPKRSAITQPTTEDVFAMF